MASKLNLNVVICVLLVVILIVSILGMERSIKAAPYSHHILDVVVEEEDSTNFNESFYNNKPKKPNHGLRIYKHQNRKTKKESHSNKTVNKNLNTIPSQQNTFKYRKTSPMETRIRVHRARP